MYRAKKRFGQNFLHDESIISRIINEINPIDGENLIEIGPGRGALTKPVLERVKLLSVIELDRDLIPGLKVLAALEEVNLTLVEQDVLTVDFSVFSENQRVFGNLPYNISTPLMFHLLEYREHIKDMHFMLQKEVADRLSASPNTKSYGQLSVVIQAVCRVEKLFDVPRDAFDPAPKVTSSIIRLTPKKTEDLPVAFSDFKALTKLAFSKRRKTLNNNFKGHFELSLLEEAEIDGTRRAESLSLAEFIKLSECVTKHKKA